MVDTGKLPKEEIDDGIRIRNDRRLLLSKADEGGAANGTADKVRTSEAEIHGGEQVTRMDGLYSEWFSERTLSGNTESSGRENGSVGRTDGKSGERERGAESKRPDAMGTADEQHPTQGGGNRSERDSLRLEEMTNIVGA